MAFICTCCIQLICKLVSVLKMLYICISEMKFECLGEWSGPGDERYLALLDTSTGVGSERQPQYRCAVCVLSYSNVIQ